MYRDPKPDELNDPIFNAIWRVIKHWDVNVPDIYEGYAMPSGNHVCMIMDEVRKEIEDILLLDPELGLVDPRPWVREIFKKKLKKP